MTVRPILFNTEMVEATLKGIKTTTRRLVKDNGLYTYCAYPPSRIYRDGDMFNVLWRYGESVTGYAIKPPYLPGDILYVRERWRVGAWSGPGFPLMAFDYADGTCGPMVDLADRDMFLRLVDQSREDARKANSVFDGIDYVWDEGQAPTRWRPSIHMPKEAARIFLRVTDVRVERLQEITDEGQKPRARTTASVCQIKCAKPLSSDFKEYGAARSSLLTNQNTAGMRTHMYG